MPRSPGSLSRDAPVPWKCLLLHPLPLGPSFDVLLTSHCAFWGSPRLLMGVIGHSWTSGCAYLGTPDLSLRLLGQFGPLSVAFGVLLPTLCAISGALPSSDCLWTPPRALGMPFGVSGTLGAYFSAQQCNLCFFWGTPGSSVCLSVHLNPLGVPLGHPGCLHFFVRVFQDPV